MLVDTPVDNDRRVLGSIAAYEAAGIDVEIVNVRQLPRTRGDWLRAAPWLAWQTIWCTVVWLITAIACLPRYRLIWRREDLARYGMRRLNLPLIFWYETYIHIWKGVVHARKFAALRDRFDIIHAHDLATLSFALPLHAYWALPVIYDSHELSAFRNRPRQSWLSGLLITAFEAAAIRRSVMGVIAVIPFGLVYMRFFSRKQIPYKLVVNDFFEADDLSKYRDEVSTSRDSAVVYIGSLIDGRGLSTLVSTYAGPQTGDVFLYSPEDNARQRTFGAAYEQHSHVHVRYGDYDKQIKADLAPYRTVHGWAGVEDICLSYRYALPNKLFQYIKYGISIIQSSNIYYYDSMVGILYNSFFFRSGGYQRGLFTYEAALTAILSTHPTARIRASENT